MRSIRSAGVVPALVLTALALAASPALAVRITAGTGSGMAGQTVDIAIATTDLTGHGVLSYQFNMTYNASLVSLTDVLEAGTLTGVAGWGDATFNPGAGTLSVSHAGTTVLSGAGTLVTLRFTVNPAATGSGFTGLNFQSFTFNEGAPLDTTTNGSLTVTATPVITVSPQSGEIVKGENLAFSVSGSVTNPVTWSTTDAGVATISPTGVLTGVAPGEVRVFAVDNAGLRDTTNGVILVRGMRVTVGSGSAFQGQSGSVPVSVTDLAGLGVRAGQFRVTFNQNLLTATGITTAGTLLDGYGSVTSGVSPGVVIVDFAGTTDLSGAGVLCHLNFDASSTTWGGTGLTLVEALFNEVLPAVRTNGSFTVNLLPSITVSPENVSLLAGQTQQFTLGGSPTPPITWSTLDGAVATIDGAGLLTAVAGGVTKVRAEDSVGATDENTSVTVYDFRVWPDTVEAAPGDTVTVPILLDRNVNALDVYSTQYTLNFNPTHLSGVAAQAAGLMGSWGTPVSNAPSGKLIVAGAGTGTLGPGTTLNTVRIAVSPSAPIPSNIPLTLSGTLFNEGFPIGLVAPGMIQVRENVGIGPGGPAGFHLAPVRPNPSRAGAAFAFTLPAASEGQRVRLSVYGVDGRLVRVVYDAPALAGRHEARWDLHTSAGRRAAPGLYFGRLEWGGQTLARSFVVLE